MDDMVRDEMKSSPTSQVLCGYVSSSISDSICSRIYRSNQVLVASFASALNTGRRLSRDECSHVFGAIFPSRESSEPVRRKRGSQVLLSTRRPSLAHACLDHDRSKRG
jgi:hypothetical protein